MIEYLVRRFFHALLTLLGISIFVFALIHAAPGDPIEFFAGPFSLQGRISSERIVEIRHAHHLDKPVAVQYLYWLADSVHFDFGRSFVDRRPVIERIREKLPNTLLLNFAAMLAALAVAIPSGIISAARPGKWVDRASALLFLLLYSLPSFWVALLLMDLLSVKLGILPLYGMTSDRYASLGSMARIADRVQHLVLPVAVLAYGELAFVARFSRGVLLEVLGKDFVTVARAKGAGEVRILIHHALRNALLPMLTILGISVPLLLSGSVIVETIFAWDGLGRMYFDSVLARDYPTIMGLTVLTAIATLASYLLTDILYSVVDPRIRLTEKAR